MVKVNYAYHIFFNKFLSLTRFRVHLNAGKHGDLQQMRAIATVTVSYTQSRRNPTTDQTTSVVDHLLTHLQYLRRKYCLVFYACSHRNL